MRLCLRMVGGVSRLPFQSPCGATSDCDQRPFDNIKSRRGAVSIPVWGDFRLRRIPIAEQGRIHLVVSIPVWGDFRLRLRDYVAHLLYKISMFQSPCGATSDCDAADAGGIAGYLFRFNPRVGRLPIATRTLLGSPRCEHDRFQSPCGATSDCDSNRTSIDADLSISFQSPCGATSDCDGR